MSRLIVVVYKAETPHSALYSVYGCCLTSNILADIHLIHPASTHSRLPQKMAELALINALDSQPRDSCSESDASKPSPRPDLNRSLKRKAQVDTQGSQKRPRHASSSAASSGFASLAPPEPLSINGILRQHSRSRLFVKPLRWKQLQLELLGCRFAFRKAGKTRKENGADRAQAPDEREQRHGHATSFDPTLLTESAICTALRRIRCLSVRSFKRSAIQTLLEGCGMCLDT